VTGLGETLRGEARDVLIFTGSNLVNRLGSLALLPLYWTRLTPADYGVLAVIAIIGAYQTLLGSLSLDLAVTRFYYEWPPEQRRENLGAVWLWSTLATLVGGSLLLVIGPAVVPPVFGAFTDRSWLILGIVGNALAGLFVVPASTVRIVRMPWLFAAYNLASFAISSALGLWLVLVQDLGLTGYLCSVIAGNAVLALVGAAVMLREAKIGLSAPGLAEATRFSLRALPANLINTSASVVDRTLLGALTDLQTLGIYSVAARFAEVIGVLHNSIKMAFGPFLMKNITTGGREGRDLVRAVTPYYLVPYFTLALALSLFVGPLVRWIDQPSYLPVEPLVPWLCAVSILASLYFYYCNGLFFAKRTDLLSVPALVNLVVVVLANVALIPAFQTGGLITSRFLAAAVLLGVTFFLSQRAFPLAHRWSPVARLAIASIVAAGLGQLIVLDLILFEVLVKIVIFICFGAMSFSLVDPSRPVGSALKLLRASRVSGSISSRNASEPATGEP
jgi:O-antigen/teichoic acid export membrane protein